MGSWLIALFVASFAVAQTRPSTVPVIPPPITHDLLAHGTDEQLWIATVDPSADRNTTGDRTIIQTRGPGDDSVWTHFAELPIRVNSLGSRASELVATLANGEWRLISSSGARPLIRSGQSLPNDAELVAIAGTEQSLWAVGFGQAPSQSAATNPTTLQVEQSSQETVSASPATLPAPRLRLYQLIAGDWQVAGDLPKGVRPHTLRPFAFAVIGGAPLVAAPTGDGLIRVYQWSTRSSGPGQWTDRELPPLPIPVNEVGLLDARRQPMLWALSKAGVMLLFTLGSDGGWSDPVEVKAAAPATQPTARTITTAFGKVWLISMDPTRRLTQQEIASSGALVGDAVEIATSTPGDMSRIGQIINLVVMLLLTWVMVVALRRRGKLQRAMLRAEQLNLAPIGQRFAAGAVDALPLIVLTLIGFSQVTIDYDAVDQLLTDPVAERWGMIAMATYLLYTTATEMIFGRTPGKMIFGLRVADLEGVRPSSRALLARNLLRIVDVMLLFPIVMILFSPLRQRVGDLAAGTIVISGDLVDRLAGSKSDEGEEAQGE